MSIYLAVLFALPIVSSMASPVPNDNWKWKYCSKFIHVSLYTIHVIGNKTNYLLNINYFLFKPYPLVVGKISVLNFSYDKGKFNYSICIILLNDNINSITC